MTYDVTYQQLYDIVTNRITALCKNIDNTNQLPAELKPGYYWLIYTSSDTTVHNTDHKKMDAKINNGINPVARSVVVSQLQQFLTDRGFWSIISQKVTPNGLIGFMTNVASFCCVHLKSASSNLVSGSYVIYDSAGYPTSTVVSTNVDLISVTDINGMINILNNVIASNLGIYTVTYTYNVWKG